ncbi:MAG: hypothetical protein AB7F59_12795 [Bdellovibrionales bacterium]
MKFLMAALFTFTASWSLASTTLKLSGSLNKKYSLSGIVSRVDERKAEYHGAIAVIDSSSRTVFSSPITLKAKEKRGNLYVNFVFEWGFYAYDFYFNTMQFPPRQNELLSGVAHLSHWETDMDGIPYPVNDGSVPAELTVTFLE